MTGLHDSDRMKGGKALVMEHIAARLDDCNVSFSLGNLKNSEIIYFYVCEHSKSNHENNAYRINLRTGSYFC